MQLRKTAKVDLWPYIQLLCYSIRVAHWSPFHTKALFFFQPWGTTSAMLGDPRTWRRPQGAEAALPHHLERPHWLCVGSCKS